MIRNSQREDKIILKNFISFKCHFTCFHRVKNRPQEIRYTMEGHVFFNNILHILKIHNNLGLAEKFQNSVFLYSPDKFYDTERSFKGN